MRVLAAALGVFSGTALAVGGLGAIPDGVYRGAPRLGAETVVRVQGASVSVELRSAQCNGDVSLQLATDGAGSATGRGGGCAVSFVVQRDGALMLSELAGCSEWRGALCTFTGPVSWRAALPAGYRSPPLSRAAPGPVQAADGLTRIEAFPPGARIIIEGEYVGQAPVTVDLRDYGADPEAKYPRMIAVRALPAGDGCVAAETIDRRIPKRMFLDMRLCRQAPSIYINE